MSSSSAPLPPNVDRATPSLPSYMWVGCGIATFVVFTRLYTRLFLTKAAGWDDLLIAIAYAFSIVLYTGTQLEINNGYGRHIEYVPIPNLIFILKLNVMTTISGFTTLALARTSIGLFLLRLVGPFKNLRIPVYVGLSINTVQAIALIIWNGVHCVPLSKTWAPSTPGHCIDGNTFVIVDRFFGCLNVIVDLIFAIYPVFILQRLSVKPKIRLAVYLLLSCGLLASVASLGRVVASDLTTPDITYNLIPLTYWALSEVTGVLILACIPAFHSLLKHIERTESWQSLKTHLIPSTFRSGESTQKSNPPWSEDAPSSKRTSSPTYSSKNLIAASTEEHNVQVRKDTYIEFSDRSLMQSRDDKTGRDEEEGGLQTNFGPGRAVTRIE